MIPNPGSPDCTTGATPIQQMATMDEPNAAITHPIDVTEGHKCSPAYIKWCRNNPHLFGNRRKKVWPKILTKALIVISRTSASEVGSFCWSRFPRRPIEVCFRGFSHFRHWFVARLGVPLRIVRPRSMENKKRGLVWDKKIPGPIDSHSLQTSVFLIRDHIILDVNSRAFLIRIKCSESESDYGVAWARNRSWGTIFFQRSVRGLRWGPGELSVFGLK